MAVEDEEHGHPAPERRREPTEGEVQRSLARYDLLKSFMPVLAVVALYIPIHAAIPIAKALAGKHTSFVFTFSVSIVITLSLAGQLFSSWRRDRERRAELERLRRRADRLEQELEAARNR